MNNYKLPLLVALLSCFMLLLVQVQSANSAHPVLSQAATGSLFFQLPGEPPIPTLEPRILPAVGGNAGLVIGASVLVLIIIGGVVLTARRRAKH